MGKVKVLLIGNYSHDRQESMLRFSSLLREGVHCQTVEVSYWGARPFAVRYLGFVKVAVKYLGYIDKFIFGALALLVMRMIGRYDAYHVLDHGNAIYAFFLPRDRTLITCHDCIAIQEAFEGRTGEKVGRFGKLFQWIIKRGLQRSGRVVAVSEQTARELTLIAEVPSRKIKVIYNSQYSDVQRVDRVLIDNVLARYSLSSDRQFILMLGSDLARKNRVGAIRAYEVFRQRSNFSPYLILAGKPLVGESLTVWKSSPFRDDIFYIGAVDNDQLSALYSGCSLFLFPSLAEGFGVPIIEAQSCGAPVVTSAVQPMPEVGGDGAVYADPYSPDDIARAIGFAFQHGEVLIAKGYRNAARFSRDNLLESYRSVYREIANGL